jgi:cytochrome c peroxidase
VRSAGVSTLSRAGIILATLLRKSLCICLALPLLVAAPTTRAIDAVAPAPMAATDDEPIAPVPAPANVDPQKLSLGKRLFEDRRLSHDGSLACTSCHDTRTNGARKPMSGDALSTSKFNTLSVFNAALNFRLNWEGNFKSFEDQAVSALENPTNLNTNVNEVLGKLREAPDIVAQFREAYGRDPDRRNFLDAMAIYERSLLTPGSPFDRWLGGDTQAITAEALHGYKLFKSFGCISCHQGANVGGNLFERSGVFSPLSGTTRPLLRVPSLRNVATRVSYFHDGSAQSLDEAVRRMGIAQLNRSLSSEEIKQVVAFLQTLTGTYRGVPVVSPKP